MDNPLARNGTRSVPTTLARRWFLRECGIGVGKMGLAALLAETCTQTARAEEANPFAPKPAHFPGNAKAVIHLFMAGAPSQLDLFDHKPELVKHDGKSLPPSIIGDQRYAFIRSDAAVMAPRFKFKKHGQCGLELGEPLSPLGAIADDIALVKSVTTDQFNHAPAQIFSTPAFPSLAGPASARG